MAHDLLLLSSLWLTDSSMSSLPLRLIIRVILGDGWHSVAEHHIGVVKCLLYLHGTIWTPADVIIYWTKYTWSNYVNVRTRQWANTCHFWYFEREFKFLDLWGQTCFLTSILLVHWPYLAAVGPQCRAWRACSHPSCSSEPHLWQRSNLHLLSWCLSSGSWNGDHRAQRIQWAEHRCWY